MALSSRTITASINYRCAPFSATLMHRGRRAALKTPSDACAEDCRGKLIWPRCPINACSPWCVPIITLRESVLTTKPRQRFSAVTCCTSNVNPPRRLSANETRKSVHPCDPPLYLVSMRGGALLKHQSCCLRTLTSFQRVSRREASLRGLGPLFQHRRYRNNSSCRGAVRPGRCDPWEHRSGVSCARRREH